MWLFFHHSNALHRNMKNWDLFSGPHIGLWPLSPHPYWKGAIKCGENLSPQPIGCIHILTKNLKGLMPLKRTHGNKQKTKSVWSFHIFSLFFSAGLLFRSFVFDNLIYHKCMTLSPSSSSSMRRSMRVHRKPLIMFRQDLLYFHEWFQRFSSSFFFPPSFCFDLFILEHKHHHLSNKYISYDIFSSSLLAIVIHFPTSFSISLQRLARQQHHRHLWNGLSASIEIAHFVSNNKSHYSLNDRKSLGILMLWFTFEFLMCD